MNDATSVEEPGYPDPGKLEMIWGEGFMSPGGPAEVSRIVGDRDIAGCDVLDVGCGLGGADAVLVRQHGARSVTGFDIQGLLVDRARERAFRLGLDDRLTYVLGSPGRLPFTDASFDVVFSKDAIIHVADKAGAFREFGRMLRPGGHLLMSDWLTGADTSQDALRTEFIELAGHDFHLVTLEAAAQHARTAGFVDLELRDCRDWYLGEAMAERDRLMGQIGRQFEDKWGTEAYRDELAFWEVLVRSVDAGVVRPGHIRARKE